MCFFFQNSDFGRILYEIIGDGIAKNYFQIQAATGQISISGNLGEQNVDSYQVIRLFK